MTVKKHALFPIAYDEVSLVDEGAAGSANVVIIKRDGSVKKRLPVSEAPPPPKVKTRKKTPKGKKKDFLSSSRKRQWKLSREEGDKSGRGSDSWEKKIKRAPKGSPAGGEFSETSSENKRKYGKNGTTKAKLDARKGKKVATGSRAEIHAQGNAHGRVSDEDSPIQSLSDVKASIANWGKKRKGIRSVERKHLLRRAKSLGASKQVLDQIRGLKVGPPSVESITSDPEQQAAIRRRRKNRGKTSGASPLPANVVVKSALSSWDTDARVRSFLEREANGR
jgi:hypothetical protein